LSPIKGPEGNIEYLLYLSKRKDLSDTAQRIDIGGIVLKAHELLR